MGAGAIGAVYGAFFHDMDKGSVSFIAGGERYERLVRDGVTVNGKQYRIHVYRPQDIPHPSDLVIVTVKNHHLSQAIEDMTHSVGDNTAILSLMNGIDSEERIGSVYGMDKVLYSMVLGIDAVREENSVTYSTQGRIFFGEKENISISRRVAHIKALFQKAGIACVVPGDMIRTMWWKFMINVGINQASAALGAAYGVFQVSAEARALMESAMGEVIEIARTKGIDLREEDIQDWLTILSGLSPRGKTSMLQDVEAGRKTEVETFAGKVIELGKRCGIPTPVNKRLFHLIGKMER